MRIRINEDIATSQGYYRSGEVCNVSKAVGKQFIESGKATLMFDYLKHLADQEGYSLVRKRNKVKITDLL